MLKFITTAGSHALSSMGHSPGLVRHQVLRSMGDFRSGERTHLANQGCQIQVEKLPDKRVVEKAKENRTLKTGEQCCGRGS